MSETVDQVVIRLAGDSGDGMQVTGDQFTRTTALAGNDLATLPDFPAEIRAPAGTREGVSAFQIHFSSHDIFTPGDTSDVLVAMNPAALVTNLPALKKGGLVIVNTDKFAKADLDKARLTKSPLEDGTLDGYQVFALGISTLTKKAVEGTGLNAKETDRCKNFFALGMMYWLYSRDVAPTERYIESKFKSPYKEANLAAMRAGWSYADTVEFFKSGPQSEHKVAVPAATDMPYGEYRNIVGNQALAIGLVAAAQRAERPLFYGSYPITPASDILHTLAPFKNYGVVTFQAEDEIAAVCSAIGASYGGSIGVTGTSGPGMALKAEAIGLAVMTELPLVVVDVQRAGPSTGMPTKTEQADLLQAIYGRNSESPVAVVAAKTPADCFDVAMEAVRVATQFMMPVIVLSDGYIGTGSEPWKLPDLDKLPDLRPKFAAPVGEGETFEPYRRNPDTLARPWAIPGTAGLEHRIGGIEKADGTGHISYDAKNHHHMCVTRAEKVKRIANTLPPTEVYGADSGVLVIGWGSTFGAIRTAVQKANTDGKKVAHVHLRWLNPLPNDLGKILRRYDKVLVPELNLGQLVKILRSEYLVDAISFAKCQGQPFRTTEISERLAALLEA